MIVYIKGITGNIYASPVFATTKKSWEIKSGVLNENGDGLILLPLLNNSTELSDFNYFEIDRTSPDDWISANDFIGFAEIVENESTIKALKKGNVVPTDNLQCVKRYGLPLPVITEFDIKSERDISIFYTACWGLHDAVIEKFIKPDNDVVIHFDTKWGKHVIITFNGVKEIQGFDNLNVIDCILESEFEIENGRIMWKITNMCTWESSGFDENPYIVADAVSWKLSID